MTLNAAQPMGLERNGISQVVGPLPSKDRETMELRTAVTPLSRRWLWLMYCGAGVGGFLWTRLSTEIAFLSWYIIINRILHHSLRTIDDQPWWGEVIRSVIGFSPIIAFLCLLTWAVLKRRPLQVPLLFLAGSAISFVWMLYQAIEAIRLIDKMD